MSFLQSNMTVGTSFHSESLGAHGMMSLVGHPIVLLTEFWARIIRSDQPRTWKLIKPSNLKELLP